MKKYILLLLSLILILSVSLSYAQKLKPAVTEPIWAVRSLDTTKYSRDLAKQMIKGEKFDKVIKTQVSQVASVNASHIALGTPYDPEFKPVFQKWITEARNRKLKVWFRGNFSGWEGWFDYEKIDSKTHLEKLEKFILENPDLFDNGDIFTPCPECENGGTGDPRDSGDVENYRKFLIDEYQVCQRSFGKINKRVTCGYFSMNMDVARLVMDKQTTKALGNIVAVDHYIDTPDQLVFDIESIAKSSGGEVVIGEFGVPIPDIHGEMSESGQAEWINEAFLKLVKNPKVIAVNYWTGVGGSTEVFKDDGSAKLAVSILREYYTLKKVVEK
jgi:hypothetical protein